MAGLRASALEGVGGVMALDDAKATLLRALEHIEEAEKELNGRAERCDLVVVYSIGFDAGDEWEEIGGWAATSGPKWMHAALLRRAADAQSEAVIAVDDESDDDEDED